MTPKRPTLKTISELSGFAVPTVSRALKDAPDIGEATKARVREIANEIGYVPNRAGVRLRTGKTNVVSIVLSTERDSIDDHTGRLIASIAQTLRSTPYHMIVTPYTDGEDILDPVRYVVETRSADALIMNQIEHDDSRVAYLMERGFPFVTYGRSRWSRDHPFFDFDNVSFGEIAARRLLERGRRDVLLVAPPRQQSYSRHMIEGLRKELAAAGRTLEILDTVTSHEPNEAMRRHFARRLSRGPGVDAIVAPSTSSAIAAVAALEHCGMVLGRDIDVFAKESGPLLCFFRREVMTVHEDVVTAGEFLAEAVVRAIEQPGLPPLQSVEVARQSAPMEELF